jgi:Leucine-rich repeat (LRR) protein
LTLGGNEVTNPWLSALEGLSHLRSLDLSACARVTETGLEENLPHFPDLRHLAVPRHLEGGEGLRFIVRHSRPTRLHLTHGMGTRDHLRLLAHDSTLEYLDLSSTHVDDGALEELTDLPRLRQLILPYTAFTDLGLQHLLRLTQPTALNLGDGWYRLSEQGIASLSSSPELRELNLSGLPVTAAALAALYPLPRLEALDLSRTQIRDDSLPPLVRFPTLRRLSLAGTAVGDAVARLNELADLEKLDLTGTAVTWAGVEPLAGLTRLQELRLPRPLRTGRALKLLSRLPRLTALDLWGWKLRDDDLKEITALAELRELSLWGNPVTEGCLEFLAALPRLRELNLFGTRLTDAGLPVLARMKGLRYLNLDCTPVTDDGLGALRRQLPHCLVVG